MDAAEMAAVDKAEHAFVQFERDIHVDAAFTLIGANKKFLFIRKPKKLAVEPKVHRQ